MRTYGDQNLSWQGLRDMARAQARYWPTTGQVNEVYPNDDGPQDYPTFTARYPEWVWRYYLSTGDRHHGGRLCSRRSRGCPTTSPGPSTRSTGLISGSRMLDERRPPVRLRLQHERRHDVEHPGRQRLPPDRRRRHPGSATRRRRRSRPSGPPPSPQPSTPCWSAPTGIYVDGLDADGRQSAHSSQLANVAALAYGVVPPARVRDGRRPTSPRSTSASSPTTGWSSSGPARRRARRRLVHDPHRPLVPGVGRHPGRRAAPSPGRRGPRAT